MLHIQQRRVSHAAHLLMIIGLFCGVSAKESCTSAKEPDIIAKELALSAKRPRHKIHSECNNMLYIQQRRVSHAAHLLIIYRSLWRCGVSTIEPCTSTKKQDTSAKEHDISANRARCSKHPEYENMFCV